jgi:hypothetical protein
VSTARQQGLGSEYQALHVFTAGATDADVLSRWQSIDDEWNSGLTTLALTIPFYTPSVKTDIEQMAADITSGQLGSGDTLITQRLSAIGGQNLLDVDFDAPTGGFSNSVVNSANSPAAQGLLGLQTAANAASGIGTTIMWILGIGFVALLLVLYTSRGGAKS